MIGNILKQYRISHDLSQYEMADLLETYQGYYCNLERDKCKPGVKMIKRIAKLLGDEKTILEWYDKENASQENYQYYQIITCYIKDNNMCTLINYDRYLASAENQIKLLKEKHKIIFWYINGFEKQYELLEWGYGL